MAKGVNKVILVGSLGQDPETRYTKSGTAITNISIATNESWTDKNSGQKQEKTEWHKIVFFNRLAEIAGEYLRKGSQVYVEGKLTTRKWQDQQGQDRYTTEVHAHEMQMLGGGQGAQQNQGQQGGYTQQQPNYGGNQQQPQRPSPPPQNQPQGAHRGAPNPPPAPNMDSFDDDTPFN